MTAAAPPTFAGPGPAAPGRPRHRGLAVAALVLGCSALAWVVTAVSLILVSPSRRPARTQTFVIPEGAADRVAAGENPLALPPSFVLLAGDTLRFVNHDRATHLIGSWSVPAGAERAVRFARPIDGSLACSVHPLGRLGIDVHPRGVDVGLTVVPTLLLGPGVAGLALAVRAVVRRLGDDDAPGLTTPGTTSER